MEHTVTTTPAAPTSNGAVPQSVELFQEDIARPRFTPRELTMIKDATGHTLSAIIQDDYSDDKFPVFAWLKLRRSGYTLTWEQMQDVLIEVKVDESATDPTSALQPPTLPRSAATGE